jgi:hypothetical protein
VALAAAHPTQRRAGIAADRIVDQRLQRRWQPGLMRHRALAPAAGSADPPAKVIAPRPKLSDAVIDRATGEPSCHRCRRNPAVALRHGFVRSEQATPALVEPFCRLPITASDVVDVDHPTNLRRGAASHQAQT